MGARFDFIDVRDQVHALEPPVVLLVMRWPSLQHATPGEAILLIVGEGCSQVLLHPGQRHCNSSLRLRSLATALLLDHHLLYILIPSNPLQRPRIRRQIPSPRHSSPSTMRVLLRTTSDRELHASLQPPLHFAHRALPPLRSSVDPHSVLATSVCLPTGIQPGCLRPDNPLHIFFIRRSLALLVLIIVLVAVVGAAARAEAVLLPFGREWLVHWRLGRGS